MDNNTHSILFMRSAGLPGRFQWRMLALVASLVLGVATPATAELACKPTLAFKEVRFSKVQNQQRTWTATLAVDASRCAETSGQFEIKFVRLKEVGPDLLFAEQFKWTPDLIEVSLNFWWDEAVQDYWIGEIAPCRCAD
ncbi:MAG: hypothetical protein JWP25_112 [Bradyrhizobium sp.]|jgi:hypothetical protein|nr:hypothetical protein [Bradyrhizobium sp.]MEA2867286.1 hypothetical protein [Bradyrhizobium sp.]